MLPYSLLDPSSTVCNVSSFQSQSLLEAVGASSASTQFLRSTFPLVKPTFIGINLQYDLYITL